MAKSSPEYTSAFSRDFARMLEKYASIKSSVQKKVDQILQDPLGPQSEPLRHNLVGLRSAPVKKNFLLVFAVCQECRRLDRQAVNSCFDCGDKPDNTVYFFTIGPHDDAYAIAKKLRDRKRMSP